MAYYVIQHSTGQIVSDSSKPARSYKTVEAARAARTRIYNKQGIHWADLLVVDQQDYQPKMVTRRNLMTGKEYQEDVNTPLCCSPSSETYWSM